MPSLIEVKKNLEATKKLGEIANAYHQIANIKMNEVREKVLKNRRFFEELLKVYQRAKLAAFLQKGGKEVKILRGKKERVVIFLSANHFFYGNLIFNIWLEVKSFLEKYPSDLIVVGKRGKYIAEAEGLGSKMFYFELDDEKPEEKNIREIVEEARNYKEIFVFYGKYKTVLSQEVVMSRISEMPLKEIEVGLEKGKLYLFEPSPEEVLDFFEREIMTSLFNQCLLEHQLAKYASRAISMYQARENAKKIGKKIETIGKKLKKQILNKKQIQIFSNLKCLKNE